MLGPHLRSSRSSTRRVLSISLFNRASIFLEAARLSLDAARPLSSPLMSPPSSSFSSSYVLVQAAAVMSVLVLVASVVEVFVPLPLPPLVLPLSLRLLRLSALSFSPWLVFSSMLS